MVLLNLFVTQVANASFIGYRQAALYERCHLVVGIIQLLKLIDMHFLLTSFFNFIKHLNSVTTINTHTHEQERWRLIASGSA